jgi:hypothetical protein
VQYEQRPARSSFPSGLRVIAVEKPNYMMRGQEDGVLRDPQYRWYQVFVGRLQQRFREFAPHVQVVDREDLVTRLTEQRRAQYFNDADPDEHPVGAGELQADAVIVPRMRFDCTRGEITDKSATGEDYLRAGMNFVPVAGAFLRQIPQNRERVQVEVSVSADLALKETRTGRVVAAYAANLTHGQTTRPGFLGAGDVDVWELDQADVWLQQLIDEHVDAFLGEFFPIARRVEIKLKDADERTAEAVALLNAGNLVGAEAQAQAGWTASNHQDKNAAFVLGYIAEQRGDHAAAAGWYSRAVQKDNDNPVFRSALQRVAGSPTGSPRSVRPVGIASASAN